MKNLLSLTASFLAFHATNALVGPGPEPEKAIEHFEKAFHDSMNYNSNSSIRLIGYKKMDIPESERADFAKNHDNDIDDDDESGVHHAYFDASTSTLRIYFPVEGALLKNGDDTIEANELGELDVNEVKGDHAVLGRKQTDDITGVDGNIIEDGVIYLSPSVKPQREYDDKIFVYDFGIKAGPHPHPEEDEDEDGNKDSEQDGSSDSPNWIPGADKRTVKRGSGGVGCYKNHGGQICSKKFNIRHGRCKYSKKTCMDYNKKGTDCKNAKKNFIGSDCYTAMKRGHCWNEIM